MINDEWTKYYSQEELGHLHLIYKMMLDDFLKICKTLNISFFLYGGTLLGAAKYSDFIPWDDDVDICMLRSEYNKFIKGYGKCCDTKYTLQTPYNCKKSPFFYTKFRLNETRYVEYENRKLKINQGIYFDIYPVDNIPDSKNEFHSFFKKSQRYLKLFSIRQSFRPSKKPNSLRLLLKCAVKLILSSLFKLIPHSYLINKMDRLLQKYNKQNTARCSCLNYPSENSYFQNPIIETKLLFAGKYYSVPSDYHAHLMRRYNDYSKDLPRHKRIGHTPYCIDFGKF